MSPRCVLFQKADCNSGVWFLLSSLLSPFSGVSVEWKSWHPTKDWTASLESVPPWSVEWESRLTQSQVDVSQDEDVHFGIIAWACCSTAQPCVTVVATVCGMPALPFHTEVAGKRVQASWAEGRAHLRGSRSSYPLTCDLTLLSSKSCPCRGECEHSSWACLWWGLAGNAFSCHRPHSETPSLA